ncbi:MAG: hypothetical protein AAGA35_03775 [Patescibacteria group bacterium]
MEEQHNHQPAPELQPEMASATGGQLPGTLKLIDNGINTVRAKFGPLCISLVVAALGAFPFIVTMMFFAQSFESGISIPMIAAVAITFLLMMVVGILNNGAIVHLIAHRDQQYSYMDSLRWASRNIISIAWIGILTMLIVMTASLALIIPGIILSFYMAFSLPVLVKEGRTGLDALLRSTQLVYGAFWKIVWRFFVIIVLVTVLSIIVSFATSILFSVFGVPGEVISEFIGFLLQTVVGWVIIAAVIEMFEHRVAHKPVYDRANFGNLVLTYKIAAIVGLFVPFIVGGAILGTVMSIMSLDEPATYDGLIEQELNRQFETGSIEALEGFEDLSEEEQAAIRDFERQLELIAQ